MLQDGTARVGVRSASSEHYAAKPPRSPDEFSAIVHPLGKTIYTGRRTLTALPCARKLGKRGALPLLWSPVIIRCHGKFRPARIVIRVFRWPFWAIAPLVQALSHSFIVANPRLRPTEPH